MTMTEPVRRPRREDVRADILRTATEAFLADGYRRTNLAEVARAAGYSKGAVYSNFGGKPELFGEVMDSRATEFADGALSEFDRIFSSEDPLQAAASLVEALTATLGSPQNWPMLLEEFRSLAAEDVRLQTIYTRWRLSQRSRLAEQIRRRRADLGLDLRLDVDAAATLLISVTNTLQLELRAAPDSMPATVLAGTLALALAGILR